MSQSLKNPTPQQIAIYVSLIVSGVLAIVFFAANEINPSSLRLEGSLFIIAGIFITTYLAVVYFLKNYIYRKIKLVYKSIRSTKVSAKEKATAIDLNTHILDDVEKEVAEWAADRNQEIETLKAMEAYRRNFLGDISHELKTPIFNIQGYIHTLLEGALYDSKINKKFLKRAAKNVERLYTIVQDLEEIAMLESGKMMLDIRNFNIRDLTLEVIEDIEMMAKEYKISIALKPGALDDFIVKADREKIRQVLINLLANSIKYGKRGGSTRIGFYDMDKYILVEVADDGIGIDQNHLHRVFERFYRVDKSRSRSRGGSGLGLSIVKHILEAHNQTINLRSTLGVGSTFGFTLEKA